MSHDAVSTKLIACVNRPLIMRQAYLPLSVCPWTMTRQELEMSVQILYLQILYNQTYRRGNDNTTVELFLGVFQVNVHVDVHSFFSIKILNIVSTWF